MQDMQVFSTLISMIALGISGLTAWLTLLRKGNLMMTQPTPLLLCYEKERAKISFFTMLYSTAFRGQVMESMYIIMKHNSQKQLFNRWCYSSESNAYAAGCYVKPEGIAQVHQFYAEDEKYMFQTGSIYLDVYGHLAKKKKHKLLRSIKIIIPIDKKSDCENMLRGLEYEWDPHKETYSLRVDRTKETDMMQRISERFRHT